MKAVFDTKPESGYRDDVAHRYQFPPQYLETVSQCVGDWIVFRRPRADGGDMAYFGVARVDRMEPDPDSPGLHNAILSQFLPFDSPVPWRQTGRYFEAPLRDLEKVSDVGRFLRGKSVRLLAESDFAEIVRLGLHDTFDPQSTAQLGMDPAEDQLAFPGLPEVEQQRRIATMLVNRKIREASFRRNVRQAYVNQCAVSGLQMVDARGLCEVQAAHIWPVSEGGPDTVRNGLALSGTIHWLFDRHLISLTDDYGLLISHRVPGPLRHLLESQRQRIILPSDRRLWPHPAYVARHRQAFESSPLDN